MFEVLNDGAVGELPDLRITSFLAEDVTLEFGKQMVLNLTVVNEGTERARDVITNFYWSPTEEFDLSTAQLVGTDSHGTLNAGEIDDNESGKIKYDDLIEFGSGWFFGVIDGDGLIAESDETNNISTGVYVELNGGVPHLADLRYDAFRAEDRQLEWGEDLLVTMHVTNEGTIDAGSSKTTFYWSETAEFNLAAAVVIDVDTHGTLKVGEMDTNEIEEISYWSIARYGSGYVFGVIGYDDPRGDLNAENNLSEGIYVELTGRTPRMLDKQDGPGESEVVVADVADVPVAPSEVFDGDWRAADVFVFDTPSVADTGGTGAMDIQDVADARPPLPGISDVSAPDVSGDADPVGTGAMIFETMDHDIWL